MRSDLKLPLKGDPGFAVANGGFPSPNEIAFDPDATAELMTAGIKSSPLINPLFKGNVFRGGHPAEWS